MGAMTIGEVARRTGIKVPTIRYYEQIRLLQAPARSDGNRRSYGDADLRRLTFIRHARDLGFDIEAIRRLLALQDQPTRSCHEVDILARRHLAETEDKISRLMGLRAELNRMIAECQGGRVDQCRIIESITQRSVGN